MVIPFDDQFDEPFDDLGDFEPGEAQIAFPAMSRGVSPTDIGSPFPELDHTPLKTALDRLVNQFGLDETPTPSSEQLQTLTEQIEEGVEATIEFAQTVARKNLPDSSPWRQIRRSSQVIEPALEAVRGIVGEGRSVLSDPDLTKHKLLDLSWDGGLKVRLLQSALVPDAVLPLLTYEPLQFGLTLLGTHPLSCAKAPREDAHGAIFGAPLESDKNERRVAEVREGAGRRVEAEHLAERLGGLIESLAVSQGFLSSGPDPRPSDPDKLIREIGVVLDGIKENLEGSLDHAGVYCESLLARLPRREGGLLEPGTVLFVKELHFLKDAALSWAMTYLPPLTEAKELLGEQLGQGERAKLEDVVSEMQRLQLALLGHLKLADPFYPVSLRLKDGPAYGTDGSDGLPMHRSDNLMTFAAANHQVDIFPLFREIEADELTGSPLRRLLGLGSDEFTTCYRQVGDLSIYRHEGAITNDNLVAIDFAVLDPKVREAVTELSANARRSIESRSNTTLRHIDPVDMPSRNGALFFTVRSTDGDVLGFSQIVVEQESFLTKPQFDQIPREKLPPGKPAEGTIMVLDPQVRAIAGKHAVYEALNNIHAEEARRAGCDYIIIRVDVSDGNPTPKKSAEGEGFKAIGHGFTTEIAGSDGVARKVLFEWYYLNL